MDNIKSYFSEQITFLKEISDVLSNNVSLPKNNHKSNQKMLNEDKCPETKHSFLQCIDIENNVEDCSKYFEKFINC